MAHNRFGFFGFISDLNFPVRPLLIPIAVMHISHELYPRKVIIEQPGVSI